ncbi:hypothetical protein [Enterococcus avium]|uniref:hypothetical protein n=1 Tax=Enterococcus avium TaxID=33945 RepID=UPI00288E5840|nr:hypothetical protein [Enterococcus avium]MDT2457551.1 hypothetical protein [Enterococcus avium]
MKYQGKSMMSLNEMAGLAIDYEGDGHVTGYPIVSGNDAYILNGVIEANDEYITINQWVPVFPESLKPVSPSLTDEQQVVLDWLKRNSNALKVPMLAIYELAELADENVRVAYRQIDRKGEFQVLAAFAEWGMKNDQ